MRALPILLLTVCAACNAPARQPEKSAAAPAGDSAAAKPAEGAAEGFTGARAVAAEPAKPSVTRYNDLPSVPDAELPEIQRLAEGETSGIAEIQPLESSKP
jgi:hypothetical protein